MTMPQSVQGVAPTAVAAPSSSNALTAGAIASSNAPATTKTTISSLEDLKKKAPDVYQKMMQGIAMSICQDMKHHQDHLKKLMREATQSH